MKVIPLTKGYDAIVDAEDYSDVARFKWTALVAKSGIIYAYRRENRKTIYLHRYIMQPSAGLVVDHANHNGLDNRRKNLRVTTHSNNHFNSRARRNAGSQYKGLYWSKQKGKWHVRAIDRDGKSHHGGFFEEELVAAEAYKNLAIKLQGEFACVKHAGT